MLADWETNTVLISDLLSQRHRELARQLETTLAAHEIPLMIVPGTADIWIRDAAPIQVDERRFTQFCYSPDYLRDGDEDLITKPEVFRKLKLARRSMRSKLIMDGGNIVGTRGVAIVTDKVFTENSDQSRSEVRDELQRGLQIERIIVIPKEPFDRFGHSDGMVRFVAEKQVVISDYRSVAPRLAERLEATLIASDLPFVRLPYVPELRIRNGIPSAVGNYVNFLRVGNLILVPAYGLREDKVASDIFSVLLPHCRVVPLSCRSLAEEGGVLNCASWTILQSSNKRN
jgi:agmatine deiminase